MQPSERDSAALTSATTGTASSSLSVDPGGLDDGVMRACVWPDCATRFNIAAAFDGTIPATGWITLRSLTGHLCPEHARRHHVPMRKESQALCECGWLSPDGATLGDLLRMWQAHAAREDLADQLARVTAERGKARAIAERAIAYVRYGSAGDYRLLVDAVDGAEETNP